MRTDYDGAYIEAWLKHLQQVKRQAHVIKTADFGATVVEFWATCQLRSLLADADAFEPTSQSISTQKFLPGTQASLDNGLSQQSDKDEVNIDTTAMQTQSALGNNLTNVARTLQSTVSSLFSCPAQIRQLVYFHIFRPDCCIVSGDCCWLSQYEHHTCKDDFAGCASF